MVGPVPSFLPINNPSRVLVDVATQAGVDLGGRLGTQLFNPNPFNPSQVALSQLGTQALAITGGSAFNALGQVVLNGGSFNQFGNIFTNNLSGGFQGLLNNTLNQAGFIPPTGNPAIDLANARGLGFTAGNFLGTSLVDGVGGQLLGSALGGAGSNLVETAAIDGLAAGIDPANLANGAINGLGSVGGASLGGLLGAGLSKALGLGREGQQILGTLGQVGGQFLGRTAANAATQALGLGRTVASGASRLAGVASNALGIAGVGLNVAFGIKDLFDGNVVKGLSNLGGTAIGAAVGSIVPGIGTLLGAALGSVLGGLFGGLFGGPSRSDIVKKITKKLEKSVGDTQKNTYEAGRETAVQALIQNGGRISGDISALLQDERIATIMNNTRGITAHNKKELKEVANQLYDEKGATGNKLQFIGERNAQSAYLAGIADVIQEYQQTGRLPAINRQGANAPKPEKQGKDGKDNKPPKNPFGLDYTGQRYAYYAGTPQAAMRQILDASDGVMDGRVDLTDGRNGDIVLRNDIAKADKDYLNDLEQQRKQGLISQDEYVRRKAFAPRRSVKVNENIWHLEHLDGKHDGALDLNYLPPEALEKILKSRGIQMAGNGLTVKDGKQTYAFDAYSLGFQGLVETPRQKK